MLIYCPQCGKESSIPNSDELAKGQTLACENCGMRFNIFTVYKSLYEEVPIAKRIADVKITLARKNYRITGQDDDVQTVTEFLRRARFESIYSDIISDLVIYSNAFIERQFEQATILRHDPATSYIMTEMVPGNVVSEEVAYLITKSGREIRSGNLTHLAVNVILTPPFGESNYGYWFNDWQLLKLILLGKVNRNRAEIVQIKQILVKNVLGGAGMDTGLFDEGSSLMPGTIQLFMMDVLLYSRRNNR